MNPGNKIIELRKDNKMSQEQFAEVLNVSRQTVSNWENYKSYPDISTIIKISNVFHISLDILLKEDKHMIAKIDKEIKNSKKYQKILLGIAIIFMIILCTFLIYIFMYNRAKNKLEKQFSTAIKENNFYKNMNGYYSLDLNNNITYTVPNQKMPSLLDFSLHFHASQLQCVIELGDDNKLIIIWLDENYYGATLYNRDTKKDIVNTGLLSGKNTDQVSVIKKATGVDEKLLNKVIKKGNDLYKDFYK